MITSYMVAQSFVSSGLPPPSLHAAAPPLIQNTFAAEAAAGFGCDRSVCEEEL